MKRLGTVFNERLPFNRAALAQALDFAAHSGGPITADTLRVGTSLGANYVKATLRLAYGTGMFFQSPYRLSPLGWRVFEMDPNLTHLDSLWLMHYHLSAPIGPGPSWWHHLVTSELRFGSHLTQVEVAQSIHDHLKETRQRTVNDSSTRALAAFFVGTYADINGLGALGLLSDPGSRVASRGYVVQSPDSPSAQVIGYCLAHTWQGLWGSSTVVDLDDLAASHSLAGSLFLGSYAFFSALQQLGTRGLVSLNQVAPPYQVERGWYSVADFISELCV